MKESRDSIQDVQLYQVELNNRTWQYVLVEISQLHPRRLVEFYMDSCGYSSTGTSSEFIVGMLPFPDNPEPIETKHSADWTGLKYLQHGVAQNRTAMGLPEVLEYTKAQDFISEYLGDVMEELGITE
jgi:hypothetical protein